METLKIVATGVPASMENYQLALNAAFAGGKAYGAALANAAIPQPEQEPVAKKMTAHRAVYFMERFKHEEKLLGPNEQAALDFVISMLEAQPEQEPVAKCAQCKKEYRHGKTGVGCPKCAPNVNIPESEFQKPITPPQPKEPEQEPYGLLNIATGVVRKSWEGTGYVGALVEVYTTPPQRTWVGLTDTEKYALSNDVAQRGVPVFEAICEAEAKLKEKNV